MTAIDMTGQHARRTSNAAAAPLDRPTKAVVVATRFVVRRRRDTLPFLRAALASGREAEAVPGFLGGTVLADLWNRQFWTVSVGVPRGRPLLRLRAGPRHGNAPNRTLGSGVAGRALADARMRSALARRNRREVRCFGATPRARAPSPTEAPGAHVEPDHVRC